MHGGVLTARTLKSIADPDELAIEIVENLEAGLESFKAIINSLNNKSWRIKYFYRIMRIKAFVRLFHIISEKFQLFRNN